MTITDQLRKRLNDYQFGSGNRSLTDVHRELIKEYSVTYNSLRSFWTAESESTGKFLNALDTFLKDRGY